MASEKTNSNSIMDATKEIMEITDDYSNSNSSDFNYKHYIVGMFSNPLTKYFSYCKNVKKIYSELEKT